MRVLVLLSIVFLPLSAFAEFTAGAAITDVTPQQLPVIVNGSMTSRSVDKVKTPLSARSLAFSDGKEVLVIVVVDSCMMPRPLLDEVKEIAAGKAGIPTEHILISATHTHSAGSCMSALGTDADPVYSLFLKKKLVEAVLAPLKKLRPAQIGWGEIDAADFTALRRWVIHPDHKQEDPFGNLTVRANMHAAQNWDHVIGPSGPEDPTLSMISVQTTDGEPIGVLANFSMHYFGDQDISSDYFGLFSNGLQSRIADSEPGFVAMMSHGCSGDIWRHDYEKTSDRSSNKTKIEDYTAGLLDLAMTAYGEIEYERPASIAMDEQRLDLAYRVPDTQLLEWSQAIVDEMGDRLPKTKPEIYAREQVLLHEKQRTEVVVQALRLGENVAIATTPNETYALTGLKIKNASPIPHTMTIELANGGDGYIPPPEQHLLGGYNTWAARSAGLEVLAEPKIAAAAIGLLEQVSGKPRTDRRPGNGSAAAHILSLKPRAYYRLDEFSGPIAHDASPHHQDALYEPQVLFQLPGPKNAAFTSSGQNRSAHFVDARLRAQVPWVESGRYGEADYSVSFWFWSGSPDGALSEPEWLFSHGDDYTEGGRFAQFGIAEDKNDERRLVYSGPGQRMGFGHNSHAEIAPIKRWTWNHVAFSRSFGNAHLWLNGVRIGIGVADADYPAYAPKTFFWGGSSSGEGHFEGKLDEIAIFDRALTDAEAQELANP